MLNAEWEFGNSSFDFKLTKWGFKTPSFMRETLLADQSWDPRFLFPAFQSSKMMPSQ